MTTIPRIIEWIPFNPDQNDEPVVWVDVSKLDESWRHDAGYYIHKGGCGQIDDRYNRFGEWFMNGHPVEMSQICLDNGVVLFTDGRHRFAWLRDRGVASLPVMVCPESEAMVIEKFGTEQRLSIIERHAPT